MLFDGCATEITLHPSPLTNNHNVYYTSRNVKILKHLLTNMLFSLQHVY